MTIRNKDIIKPPKTKLTRSINPKDKYIYTTRGNYKVRKNGRLVLAIDGGKDKEIVRVTPV